MFFNSLKVWGNTIYKDKKSLIFLCVKYKSNYVVFFFLFPSYHFVIATKAPQGTDLSEIPSFSLFIHNYLSLFLIVSNISILQTMLIYKRPIIFKPHFESSDSTLTCCQILETFKTTYFKKKLKSTHSEY